MFKSQSDITIELELLFNDRGKAKVVEEWLGNFDPRYRKDLLLDLFKLARMMREKRLGPPDEIFSKFFLLSRDPLELKILAIHMQYFARAVSTPPAEKFAVGLVNALFQYKLLHFRGIESAEKTFQDTLLVGMEKLRTAEQVRVFLGFASRLCTQRIDVRKIIRTAVFCGERFTKNSEQANELLIQLEALIKNSIKNRLADLDDLATGILATAEAVDSPTRLYGVLRLCMKLVHEHMDPIPSLKYAVPTIAKMNVDFSQWEKFLSLLQEMAFQIKEKEAGVDMHHTFQYALPAIAQVTQSPEVFRHVLDFGISLAKSGIYPGYTLHHGIPTICNLARSTEELKLILNLGYALMKRGIEPAGIFQSALPVVVEYTKDAEEFKLLMLLSTRLADLGIDPTYMLQYGIPVAKDSVGKDLERFRLSLELQTHLLEKRYDAGSFLEKILPSLAKAVDDLPRFKLTINFAFSLMEKNINPRLFLDILIPALAPHVPQVDDYERLLASIGKVALYLDKEKLDGMSVAISTLYGLGAGGPDSRFILSAAASAVEGLSKVALEKKKEAI